jgi:DNA-binding CsgD family transcriptional regulator
MGANELDKRRAAYAARQLGAEQHRRPRASRTLTARAQAEREVAAHIAVADALVAWDGADNGFAGLLAGLAGALDREVGVFWVPRGDRLRPRAFWHTDKVELGEFKVMTLTSRLPRGVELPGQAWQQLEARGRDGVDGPVPPRWRAALATGLREAIAFPAVWQGDAIAVIELVSREEPELTDRLKRSLAAIGYVLGSFLAQRRGVLDEHLITGRQAEILGLAARGLSGREIAERLAVSPNTIKTHFENSYARLGVSSRAAAVAEAVRLGLVD